MSRKYSDAELANEQELTGANDPAPAEVGANGLTPEANAKEVADLSGAGVNADGSGITAGDAIAENQHETEQAANAEAAALTESGKPFFVGHGVNPELTGMELFEGLQLARFVTFNREAGKAVVNFARFDDDGSIETITLPASSLAGMKEAAIKKHVAALDTNAAAKKTIKAALGKAKGMTEAELLAMFRELMTETPEPDADATTE